MKNILESIKNSSLYRIKEYKTNEIIFSEDSIVDSVCFIIDGIVSIKSSTPDGYLFEIARLSKYDIFADNLLFEISPKVKGDIISLSPTKIAYIKYNVFIDLLSTNKVFLCDYLKYQTNKQIYSIYRIKLLSQPSIKEKILFFLKEEKKRQHSNRIMLNMTKEELSNLLSLNRPSLSRELIRLKNENIIDYDRYSITLLL